MQFCICQWSFVTNIYVLQWSQVKLFYVGIIVTTIKVTMLSRNIGACLRCHADLPTLALFTETRGREREMTPTQPGTVIRHCNYEGDIDYCIQVTLIFGIIIYRLKLLKFHLRRHYTKVIQTFLLTTSYNMNVSSIALLWKKLNAIPFMNFTRTMLIVAVNKYSTLGEIHTREIEVDSMKYKRHNIETHLCVHLKK